MGGSGVKRDENIVHNFTKTGAQLMNRSNEYERAVSNNGTSPVVMSAWTRSPEVQVDHPSGSLSLPSRSD